MQHERQPLIVRPLRSIDETDACARLQREIWHFSDLEIVSPHLFVVAQKIGGQAFGAFEGDRVVGFVLSFPGLRDGEYYLHSHMVGVLPEFQDRGVGRQLKLAQREDALRRGIALIEWTFDPLQLKNAHFNVARLGVIIRRYLPNLYGRTSSELHHGLPTDRFVAEWWIGQARAENALKGNPDPPREDVQRIFTAPIALCVATERSGFPISVVYAFSRRELAQNEISASLATQPANSSKSFFGKPGTFSYPLPLLCINLTKPVCSASGTNLIFRPKDLVWASIGAQCQHRASYGVFL